MPQVTLAHITARMTATMCCQTSGLQWLKSVSNNVVQVKRLWLLLLLYQGGRGECDGEAQRQQDRQPHRALRVGAPQEGRHAEHRLQHHRPGALSAHMDCDATLAAKMGRGN